jgi:predicted DNA-binding transcriptional regulator AlpA
MKQLLDLFRETLETTLTGALARLPAVSVPRPSPKTTSLDLAEGEKLKAADLRLALLTGKIPENTGLLIDAKTLAKLLAISRAHLYRLQAEEALLAPIQFGHVKRWRLTEVIGWIEAGCPPQNMGMQ